jgi:hypothetical protein
MPTNRPNPGDNPSESQPYAMSMAETARRLGLSRSRFYELLARGVFPQPSTHPGTGRPYFNPDQQAACLEVRRTYRGINGEILLFYPQRSKSAKPRPQSAVRRASPPRAQPLGMASLVEGLKSLGLTEVEPARLNAALAACFPDGVQGHAEGAVISGVFRFLNRQSTPDMDAG